MDHNQVVDAAESGQTEVEARDRVDTIVLMVDTLIRAVRENVDAIDQGTPHCKAKALWVNDATNCLIAAGEYVAELSKLGRRPIASARAR